MFRILLAVSFRSRDISLSFLLIGEALVFIMSILYHPLSVFGRGGIGILSSPFLIFLDSRILTMFL